MFGVELLILVLSGGAALPKCPSKPTPGAMYHSGLNRLSISTEISKISLGEIFAGKAGKIFRKRNTISP